MPGVLFSASLRYASPVPWYGSLQQRPVPRTRTPRFKHNTVNRQTRLAWTTSKTMRQESQQNQRFQVFAFSINTLIDDYSDKEEFFFAGTISKSWGYFVRRFGCPVKASRRRSEATRDTVQTIRLSFCGIQSELVTLPRHPQPRLFLYTEYTTGG